MLEYADAIERAMYNGVLAGMSLTGTRFFYTNPLQRRTHRASEPLNSGERAPWFPCACCPPNLMRLLSSWQQYLATSDDGGVQIHQYGTADIRATIPAGPGGEVASAEANVQLAVSTNYPWHGRVSVHIVQTPDQPWTLSLRVPRWSRSATITGPGESAPTSATPGTTELFRQWVAGDTVVLDLDLPVRITEPDPRIDAVRGCVAIERGPLVYCIESADVPPDVQLEDLHMDPVRQPVTMARPDVGDAIIGVSAPVVHPPSGTALMAGAIPYYAWANRRVDGMRVWIPR